MGLAQKAPKRPSNATVDQVDQTTTTVELLAANANRQGGVIYNGVTTGVLYVKLGSGASSDSHTVALLPLNSYSLDYPAYTGQVTGAWSIDGTGKARVTETF